MGGVFRLGAPSEADLARDLAEQGGRDLSYDEVGATRGPGDFPPGYHHVRHSAVIGHGVGDFGRACQGLREWQAHAGIGATVEPPGAPLATGTTVLVVARLAVLRVVAACRIVYTADEPDCFGFAYGTLPLHPEQGEERFVVALDGPGAVRFEVAAFSRPAHPLARLGQPVTELVQSRATRDYVAGLERFVRSG